MNMINGIPILDEKSIDLCLTDPPYDTEDITWIDEVLRVCNGLIFTPGKSLYFDYIRYKKPDYQSKYWYKVNTQGTDLIEPFLCYGNIKNINKLRAVFEFPFRQPQKRIGKHPYPKNATMWYHLLYKLQPSSVLDPFLGSGTTAMCCIMLDIPYLGYEMNLDFKEKIEDRLKHTIKQNSIKEWL